MLQDETNAVIEVMKSGVLDGFRGEPGEQFYGGPKVREFESAFAEKFGVKYAVAFNSCTAALHAACVATLDKGEAITTPFTMTSTAKCALMAGGTVKFADIEPETFCIDPYKIEITSKTKVLIPVHLFGHPADMDAIMSIARKHNLKVIEDSAQAIGATYKGRLTGTIGDCGVFSFGQPKTLSTGYDSRF